MRKILIYIVFCLFLIIVPSIVTAIPSQQTPAGNGIFRDWTILIGFVTRHRHVQINGYEYVEFNALFLHYRTHWFGNIRTGFFHRFERIALPSYHYGYLGAHFVAAQFNMGLTPY